VTAAIAPLPRLAGAIVRPFDLAGGVVRSSVSMLFARGRGWSLFVQRTRIDYQREVGDPATNSIVAACVAWIARNFPTAPVRVIREDDPEAQPITRATPGVGRMLQLLEKPNDWFSGVLQWQATLIDYICESDAYWFKVRSGLGQQQDPVVALWWVPAGMVEPRWNPDNPSEFIGWYEYLVDGVPYRVETWNVVHFRNGIDPKNPRKGRSPLRSLLREIYTDEEASQFTASLLRNLGVPGVVIAPANTTGARQRLNVDTESIKQKFQDTFAGDGRGEPLVLNSPTEIKVLSFNPQELALKDLRRIPEERISGVLGVAAGVAGLGAGLDRNTFTNYGEARKASYEEGIIPLHVLFGADLEAQLLIEFVGQDLDVLDVIFDHSKVSAMAEAAADVWKRAESAAGRGLIKRKAFKLLAGLPVDEDTDDVYVMPNNYVVVDGATSEVLVNPGAKAARPAAIAAQLEPGPAIAGEIPAVAGGPVKCSTETCGKLLAEHATSPYRFTCPRCKAVTASPELQTREEPVAA
jgi:HK97 family phage portal protein